MILKFPQNRHRPGNYGPAGTVHAPLRMETIYAGGTDR